MSKLTAQTKIQQFFASGTRLRFKKQEIIIRPGEKLPSVYLIESGFIKIYSLHKSGDEAIQLVLSRGDFFPGRWLIHYRENDLYYEAITELVVWRRRRSELAAALGEDPALLMEVTEYTYDIFRLFMDRLKSMQQKSAGDRLISYLLLMAGRFGIDHPQGTKITCPITHQHIASCINLSRETASREFEKLKTKGLVAYDEQSYLIVTDQDRLAKLLA